MVKPPRQSGSEHKRRDHPCERHGDRTAQVLADDIHAELQSHDEHVQSQSQLGGREKVALGVAYGLGAVPGKEGGLGLRQEEAEERGAQEDACNHFRDDLGLSETRGHSAYNPAKEEDDSQLEEEMNGELEVVHGGRDGKI